MCVFYRLIIIQSIIITVGFTAAIKQPHMLFLKQCISVPSKLVKIKDID